MPRANTALPRSTAWKCNDHGSRVLALPKFLPPILGHLENLFSSLCCVFLLCDNVDHLLRREDFPHPAACYDEETVLRRESKLLYCRFEGDSDLFRNRITDGTRERNSRRALSATPHAQLTNLAKLHVITRSDPSARCDDALPLLIDPGVVVRAKLHPSGRINAPCQNRLRVAHVGNNQIPALCTVQHYCSRRAAIGDVNIFSRTCLSIELREACFDPCGAVCDTQVLKVLFNMILDQLCNSFSISAVAIYHSSDTQPGICHEGL
mmetsp:Transcript_30896/g.51145  ORF Transcript_30896/g.51145 Transcript_30896/m.51145 type:complete len:265 (-) Transcript_30896:244-1038(-)